MNFEAFTTAIAIAAVVYVSTNFVKYLLAKDWNGVITILVACAIGAGVVWLFGQANVTEHFKPLTDGPEVGDYDFGSIVVAGIALAAVAGVLKDFFASRDNTQSASKPKLLPSQSKTPPA